MIPGDVFEQGFDALGFKGLILEWAIALFSTRREHVAQSAEGVELYCLILIRIADDLGKNSSRVLLAGPREARQQHHCIEPGNELIAPQDFLQALCQAFAKFIGEYLLLRIERATGIARIANVFEGFSAQISHALAPFAPL